LEKKAPRVMNLSKKGGKDQGRGKDAIWKEAGEKSERVSFGSFSQKTTGACTEAEYRKTRGSIERGASTCYGPPNGMWSQNSKKKKGSGK